MTVCLLVVDVPTFGGADRLDPTQGRELDAGFRSLAEVIDTTPPAGNLVFNASGAIAQFKCERIAERT